MFEKELQAESIHYQGHIIQSQTVYGFWINLSHAKHRLWYLLYAKCVTTSCWQGHGEPPCAYTHVHTLFTFSCSFQFTSSVAPEYNLIMQVLQEVWISENTFVRWTDRRSDFAVLLTRPLVSNAHLFIEFNDFFKIFVFGAMYYFSPENPALQGLFWVGMSLSCSPIRSLDKVTLRWQWHKYCQTLSLFTQFKKTVL